MTHTIGNYTTEEVRKRYGLAILMFLDAYVKEDMRGDALYALELLIAEAMSVAEEEAYEDARDNPVHNERDH